MEMAAIRAMRASAWFVKVLTEINGSVWVCERAHPGMAPEYIRPSARAQQSASCGGGEPWRAAEPSAHMGRFLVACRCLRDSWAAKRSFCLKFLVQFAVYTKLASCPYSSQAGEEYTFYKQQEWTQRHDQYFLQTSISDILRCSCTLLPWLYLFAAGFFLYCVCECACFSLFAFCSACGFHFLP